MEPTDITIQILTEIRDSVREVKSGLDQTNERLDQTNERLDQTNERLDQTNKRLEALTNRVTESEIRTATAITALGGTLEDVKTLLRDRLDLRDRLERCETDIKTLKQHAGIG